MLIFALLSMIAQDDPARAIGRTKIYAEYDSAEEVYHACLKRSIPEADDGVSDASTIVVALPEHCVFERAEFIEAAGNRRIFDDGAVVMSGTDALMAGNEALVDYANRERAALIGAVLENRSKTR